MSRQVFRNNVFTKLAGAITDSQTVFAVADGSVLYSPGANEVSYITLQSKNIRSQVEVVQLLSVAGNNVTVVRGVEGTQYSFSANDIVEQRVTAGSLDNFLQTEDVTTSDTAPVNPRKNQRWVDGTDGVEYFWYDNGTSQQWVEIGTQVYGTDPAPPPAVTAHDMYQDQQTALVAADVLAVAGDAAAAQATADGAAADAAAAQSTADGAVADAAAAQSTAATADGKADNNADCLGVSNDTDMGLFDGALLPDDQTVKQLLQVLETRVERTPQVFNCVLNGSTGTPTGGVDGFTFNDMNYLLAAMPNFCTINVDVTGYAGTWSKVAGTVTKIGCSIHIDIVANGSPIPKGITITALDSSYIAVFTDCEVHIKGVGLVYNTIVRMVAGASGISATAFYANNSLVNMDTLTVQFANSAAHAAGCDFALFYQAVGAARLNSITVEWDTVFTPVPNASGVQVLKCGSTGENWNDHDVDVSNMVVMYPTTLYYAGRTNRKYVSFSFTSASPEPAILAANRKNVFSLSTTGKVMQSITSAMLKLTCIAADLNFAIGDEIYFALGGSGTAEGNEKGAYLVGNRAGTKQIVELWLFIAASGLTHARNTPAYNVELLDLTKWSAQLYCRDES